MIKWKYTQKKQYDKVLIFNLKLNKAQTRIHNQK